MTLTPLTLINLNHFVIFVAFLIVHKSWTSVKQQVQQVAVWWRGWARQIAWPKGWAKHHGVGRWSVDQRFEDFTRPRIEGTMKGQWRDNEGDPGAPRDADRRHDGDMVRWRVVPRDRVRRSLNDCGWTRTTTSFNKDNAATLRVTGRRRRSGGLCWLCSKRIARAFSTEASYSYCKFLQKIMNVKPFFPCSIHKGFVIPIHFFS